jgi:hypothetical protein
VALERRARVVPRSAALINAGGVIDRWTTAGMSTVMLFVDRPTSFAGNAGHLQDIG